jgi:hypothetical protein
MPSMHAAWTLLAWWCAFGLRPWIKLVTTAALGFTLLATLGLGEHYLVDLVVAFSFAVAISALCRRGVAWSIPERWQALAICGGITLAWLVSIRQGWMSSLPGLAAWTAVVLTVAAASILQIRLLRAGKPLTPPGSPA